MLQRLLNILGWLGTALVFVAVAMRWLKPEWAQYAIWIAWSGLGGVLLYTAGQWREIAAMFTRTFHSGFWTLASGGAKLKNSQNK